METASLLKVKSRSVAASVVRRGGAKWGVLVLDSRKPDGIAESEEKKALVSLAADFLSVMI